MVPCAEYFAKNLLEGSRSSAQVIAPLVLELVQPRSVIDVGCGTGAWLAVFQELGVTEIFGIDGDWADRNMLAIPQECFLAIDLKKPLRMERQFDLVLCLEVAQHLPSASAETLVASLTGLGPVILFSAAIPFQQGIHHVNEQWPDYWVKCFNDRGYAVLDPIRRRIWANEQVEWWFAQNTLLFARQDYVESHPALRKELERTHPAQLNLVHPRKYLQVNEWLERMRLTAEDITALIPPGDAFILVDDGQCEHMVAAGRRAIPFLERRGRYWGKPKDDATAIRELKRLRQAGAKFIVFARPAFWWLDYYAELHRYLRSEFCCVLENDRLVTFDLRPARSRVRTGLADKQPERRRKLAQAKRRG